jgi:hypothetical protein
MSIEAELIKRYGPNVLSVKRNNIPPQRAKPKHRLVVKPRAGARERLVKELRREGGKAQVARDRQTKQVNANFVMTNCLPAFTRHALGVLAELPNEQLIRLWGTRPRAKPIASIEFQPGDRVRIKPGVLSLPSGDDVTGKLVRRMHRAWHVDIGMPGTVVVLRSDMILIDPGG